MNYSPLEPGEWPFGMRMLLLLVVPDAHRIYLNVHYTTGFILENAYLAIFHDPSTLRSMNNS